MHLHYIQHVPFETPAAILDWAEKAGCTITKTRLFANETPPPPKEIDILIVMGGPMGIYDESEYPWLVQEKKFLDEAINSNTIIIGICLGAQLLADRLGEKVFANEEKEIGWFPISLSKDIASHPCFHHFPKTFNALHWHGDTFTIPKDAIPLGSSEACKNQGFIFQNRIFAFQFHIEATPESTAALIKNCGNELIEAPYVDSAENIKADTELYHADANTLLCRLLENSITPK